MLIKDAANNYLRTIRWRDPYKWCLDTAGWFIDPGESAEQAGRRECLEELGIELGSLEYIWTFSGQYERCEITRPIINIVFETTITESQKTLLTFDDEIAGVERHRLDSLPVDRLAKNIKWILPLLIK
jgi:8-oxo-dGTP pyrophosphatase MutT (NUDIX family)